MISKNLEYLNESRSLIEKALEFEDYLLRRTLGLYYIGWGSAFFLFTFSGFFYQYISMYPWLLLLPYIAGSVIVMVFTANVFSKAARASNIMMRAKWKRYRTLTALSFLIILGILSGAALVGFYSYLVLLYAFLAVYVPWSIMNVLKKSMARMHLETWAAISSFVLACIVSALSIVARDYLILTIVWLAEAIAWFACGLAGIYNANYQSVIITDDE